MPIYEYVCAVCSHDFERLMRIGADAPPCPECESTEVTKKVSASGFILKGGGWYKDHYGLKGGGKSSSDSGAPKKGADGGSSGSSDSSGSSGSDSKSSSSSEGGTGKSGGKTKTSKSTTSSSGD